MLCISILFALFSLTIARDLPQSYPRCNRDSLRSTNCIINATEIVRDSLIKGIKELGIPAIDPLFIPILTFEQGSKSLNFKITITNATITGLGKYTFDDFWFDTKELKFHNHCKLTTLKLVGQCEIDGRILVIPLRGRGTITTVLAPSEVYADIKGKLIKRDGKDYYKITDLEVQQPLEDGVTRFDNFVGAPPEIVESINQVFKENSKELIQEIAAPIQQITVDITRTVFEGITSRVPFDKLFPVVTSK